MNGRRRSYKEDLLESLKDPEAAREYLNAALEDGDREVFLLAVRDVAEAQLGTSQLERGNVSDRNSVPEASRLVSETGNLELSNVRSLLESLGYRLAVVSER